ncbi:pro-resilin-like [Homalodisca vitripennis]|uniref:pro-resilin-like n=1 Tax=Homalodisca vitripennis TaxID=197043 RepID=UPI001EEA7D48|nr:pro-resilin-like [Homalodisca vitripennis]
MKISLCLALCVLAVVQARPEPPSSGYGPPRSSYGAPGGGGGYGGGDDHSEVANYNFMYEVKDAPSGNDFGHMESRMGEVAKGSYHVLLPDGRMQRVDYVADQGGYQPTVTYQGEAKYGPGVGGGKARRWRRRWRWILLQAITCQITCLVTDYY